MLNHILNQMLDIPLWMSLLPLAVVISVGLILMTYVVIHLFIWEMTVGRENKKKIDEAFIHYQKEQEAYRLERKKQNSDQFCLALKRLAESNREKYGR